MDNMDHCLKGVDKWFPLGSFDKKMENENILKGNAWLCTWQYLEVVRMQIFNQSFSFIEYQICRSL